jgi:hypothetical protein
MSGIDREITPDPRPRLIDRHLPNTPQIQRLLRKEADYKLVVAHPNYQAAQDWLLEDEYERVKGKLLAEEII